MNHTNHPYPLWHPIYWLATWFYSGLAPKAPGTFGTLAALPFAWVIHVEFGDYGLLIAAILAFFIGWWVSAEYVKKTGREDPKEVVIDEVAGMWLTIGIIPAIGDFSEPVIGIYIILFLGFRFFDILKPWPISWCDRHIKGGFGIMLDDILAAILALIILSVLAILFVYSGLAGI